MVAGLGKLNQNHVIKKPLPTQKFAKFLHMLLMLFQKMVEKRKKRVSLSEWLASRLPQNQSNCTEAATVIVSSNRLLTATIIDSPAKVFS